MSQLTKNDTVLLLTGVANPRSFVKYFNQYDCSVKVCHYPDHHEFSRKDILRISKIFSDIKSERKLIITTEKDAVRLATNPYFPHELKTFVYYVPIKVDVFNKLEDDDFLCELKKGITK